MLAAGARAGGRGAGREPGTRGAHRGHRLLSLAAPENQCSARPSSAETRARRLRSRTPVAGGWRKPLGGGRSRGGFPSAAGWRAGTRRGAGGAAASEEARAPGPAPAGPILAKVKSEAGAPRRRGDSAPGCFAGERRNARAGEPDAITTEPERPCGGRPRPSPPAAPGMRAKVGVGGRRELSLLWHRERPDPRGPEPPRTSGLRAGVGEVSQRPRHRARFCIFPGVWAPGPASLPASDPGIPGAHWARRPSGCVGGGVHPGAPLN